MCIASAASPNTNTLAPAPATPAAQAQLVVENILNVNVPVVTLGTRLVESVNQVAPSARCITATALAPAVKLAAKPCSVWLFTKNLPARMAGL